ncbi:MAG: hypothetical protein AAB909_02215 [Patescibacteria group bacterium]
MASAQPPKSLSNARSYFAQFSYPITKSEAIYWQSPFAPSRHSRSNRESSLIRKQRFVFSKPKWQIAKKIGESLSHIPTIQAIFVTGALSMDNCPEDDDIDIMLVTRPHTLWLTRAIVVVYLTLKNLRRPPSLPEHSSPRVKDKICDNLYLDANSLRLTTNDLYIAHEILQAKCIFDRGGIHHQFLAQNSWVKKYLPVAYKQTLSSLVMLSRNEASRPNLLFKILNSLFFLLQYSYMKPKITQEKITLGSAFFHPRSSISASQDAF